MDESDNAQIVVSIIKYKRAKLFTYIRKIKFMEIIILLLNINLDKY